ncbi:hypothetical protein FOZ76_21215 [Verticiella sediminum]|uniref:Uncharacterized protein n=1 Tax=Verticiella sediminum TaxID=1247510 RepID=A0A556ABV3_9BURK|nr:hypothetical protein [Verticiella sediminum]TSH90347.1 hypothetical protein FOZ76_21215 [Verticiella sediminum]
MDSTGEKTLTITHGLGYAPTPAMWSASIVRDTVVADFQIGRVWIVQSTDLVVGIRVLITAASSTAGAVATLMARLDALSADGFDLRTMNA